ncbi:NAD-dependent epimerase/dehydratase family protein [Vibrio europaeus]|uniref:NAD-dependent epimerase/dehydratase family protein n=1 Tax=Vibrio europaeus TaxID=300876 RepID=A0A178JAI1_9VIBR|nr:NAD-dependent epimerase/dehydratase family protein [Vibrio europaeus]MDC5703091.1 NAD-dependent epimerase/dehydratase family protein [Vibrio europaeus]MDC5708677.1 NAD-dependent epimerase/dehydratase family protein [Vibrio europaeus]MDC5712983.1 NAD-dependent epimerase/dehydratase family protein [Vibrio europaeus]MDC5717996.1 NAD-dependent epimerase/dehydratase family protein [Vibrio europaeus]MDC5725403.1 NAD-dependent epimerase/dehydratase family protein [Vibrio europaeus]
MLVITGSSGFIGTHLTKSLYGKQTLLLRRGCTSQSNGNILYTNSPSELLSHRERFSKSDVIIHLAGLAHVKGAPAEAFFRANVSYPVELFKVAEKLELKRFVFISTVGVNGESTSGVPFSDCSSIEPHNEYAKSKYQAEAELQALSEKSKVELVIVRPPLVYGANAPGNFRRLTKLISTFGITPFGLIKNARSFVAVENLCSLIKVCAEHSAATGHIFYPSDQDALSTKDFASNIAKGLGRKVVHLPIPILCLRLIGYLLGKKTMINQLVRDLEVDSSSASRLLGWTAPLSTSQAMCSLKEKYDDTSD